MLRGDGLVEGVGWTPLTEERKPEREGGTLGREASWLKARVGSGALTWGGGSRGPVAIRPSGVGSPWRAQIPTGRRYF